jgi:hypothetical protein
MNDRLDQIESELERLADRLGLIEDRLSNVEGLAGDTPPRQVFDQDEPGVPATPSTPQTSPEHHRVAHVLGLLGRTFLVLCGGFLLRSLTDAEILPLALGVGVGLGYAVFWLIWADRGAGANRTLSAVLSGLAAAAIAYPLLWEATTRFSLLPASAAIITLAVFTAMALAVTWRRDLEVLGWVVTAAALITTLIIMVSSRSWYTGTVVGILIGGASVWFAYTRGWTALRWPVAVVVDLLPLIVLSVYLRSSTLGVPEGPAAPAAFALFAVFLVTYLGSFAYRTLKQGHDVGAFEAVQTAICLLIALAGTAVVTRHAGIHTGAIGWAAIFGGVLCYAVSFAFVDRRQGRTRTFLYYTSLALILVIWGLAVMADDQITAVVLCGLGVSAAVLGGRFDRVTLRVHSAIFVAIAFIVGGMGGRIADALVLPLSDMTRPVDLGLVVVSISALISYLVLAVARGDAAITWEARVPALALAMHALAGTATVVLLALFGLLDRSGEIDPSVIAAMRTALLSLSAIALAGLGARLRLLELSWLVYPLLVATGTKLLLEDLRLGRPLSLFISFAFFGVALIVAPRWLRKPATEEEDDGSG